MSKNNNSIAIIPARYASTRFPGKPLADIDGISMIRRVYEQAMQSRLVDLVVVATDDDRIFRHVKDFNGRVVMTSRFHKSGTERCAEVAALPGYRDFGIVVNVQGDEPFINPRQIDLAVEFLRQQPAFGIATLAKVIHKKEELFNPNTVKVVYDDHFRAMYFSRSTIPFIRDEPREKWEDLGVVHKHIGLYVFRRDVLLDIAGRSPGRLEKAESLEQLRWLEAGIPVGIAVTDLDSHGVDVPSDLERYK